MADTRAQLLAEQWVREHGLPELCGTSFTKRPLHIGTRSDGLPATHEFDAVSEDGRIVASVKASSGMTSGGNVPSGKLKDAYTELHFLGLAAAERKILVLTDKDFSRIFTRESDGKRPPKVEVVHIPLPPSIQRKVDESRAVASKEVSPR